MRLRVRRIVSICCYIFQGSRQLYFRPPFLPPLRELDLLRFFPRPPPPLFRPPLSDLFTVAHARRSASLLLTPRFSQPFSMSWAFRFCLEVYFFLLPRGIRLPSELFDKANAFPRPIGLGYFTLHP